MGFQQSLKLFIIMLFHSLLNFIRYHISNFKLKIGSISLSSCNCFMIAVVAIFYAIKIFFKKSNKWTLGSLEQNIWESISLCC